METKANILYQQLPLQIKKNIAVIIQMELERMMDTPELTELRKALHSLTSSYSFSLTQLKFSILHVLFYCVASELHMALPI